jgi:hypothetical protein
MVKSQIPKPLDSKEQTHSLPKRDRTAGGEVKCFGQHKRAVSITNAHPYTCSVERIRERSINVTLHSALLRSLPFGRRRGRRGYFVVIPRPSMKRDSGDRRSFSNGIRCPPIFDQVKSSINHLSWRFIDILPEFKVAMFP